MIHPSALRTPHLRISSLVTTLRAYIWSYDNTFSIRPSQLPIHSVHSPLEAGGDSIIDVGERTNHHGGTK